MYPRHPTGQTSTFFALAGRAIDPRARRALTEQLGSRRTWIWAAVLAALAIGLAFVPLFDTVGYEFSFAMALAASFAAADLGAALARRLTAASAPGAAPGEPAAQTDTARHPLPDGPTAGFRVVFSAAGAAALVGLALIVVPLALMALNGLRVRTCAWGFGLACYGAMTALSVVWSGALGAGLGLLTGHRRRVLANALPILVLLGLVIHSLWRFYAAPPVFSYNPLVGFYSGNLYDEQITLDAPLLWSRLHEFLMLGGGLMLLAALIDAPTARPSRAARQPAGLRGFELILCLILLLSGVLLRANAGSLGFSLSAADLADALPGRYETAHFIIHYPPGGDIERDIALIGADHEFRLAQVTRDLGVPPPAEKIDSYYCESAEQKAALLGARHVDMAKPWRHEIYVNHAAFPHPLLRHEIAHVVAGEFGDPLFGVSARRVLGVPLFFNVGLIEGLAVAADWPDHFSHPLTPHQSVKAMLEMHMAPPIQRLLSTGFFAFSSARSYTAAGSFVRFLLDRYGAARLRQLYQSGGDFEAAYGRPAAALAGEWQRMIEAIPMPPRRAEAVRERFRRGSIFQRPCPHAVADLQSEVAHLAGRGEIEQAIALERRICSDVPDEPTYLMDLGALMVRAGHLDQARALYQGLADDQAGVSSTVRAQALLALAALAAHAGDRARQTSLLDDAAALPTGDDLARNVGAQQFAARHDGPAGPALRSYFWQPRLDQPADPMVELGRAAAAALAEPDLALAHYLIGRNLSGRGAPAEAARSLRRALDLGLGDPLLTRECAGLLAAAAYQAGDLATVEHAAHILTATTQPRVTQLLGYDWLERARWKRTGHLPPGRLGPSPTPALGSAPAPAPAAAPAAATSR